MKSLIVEDEFTSRMQIKYFLEDYGNCDIAVNGTEAIKAYKMAIVNNKPYDLVCLDINLPEKSGHQVLKEIRTLDTEMGNPLKHATIVFMTTALANEKSVNDTQGLCDEYLLKPIEKTMLDERLRKHKLLK